MSESPCVAPLTDDQAREVLRYWLASLQLDEALASRPRARRPQASAPAPRLEAPTAGHDYFKVPLDDALTSLLLEQRTLHKPFDAELSGFFETWLLGQYRRGEEDRDVSHMIAFPVVHLARGDLAGLIRCGVRMRFGMAGGAQFHVPSRSERRRKQYPQPPDEVRLTASERSPRQWPFFVDTRLLQQQLGVARESIDDFFDALREDPDLDEATMLRKVAELLERELGAPPTATAQDTSTSNGANARSGPNRASRANARGGGNAQSGADPRSGANATDDDKALLSRITAAMAQLLQRHSARARVYPVAIAVDGTRAKTTWYLQRELQALLDEEPEVAWERASCLGSYLTGAAQPMGRTPQRAQFNGPPLSDSQRYASERAWGSRLTAVQGPPGTGKTTLILHMAAESLVRQVDSLADKGEMGRAAFVVTSTNNRAVDNVIDALETGETRLPLALRAGSQRVCEQLLSVQLQRALNFLTIAQTRTAAERTASLTAALEQFRNVRSELQDLLAAHTRCCELETQRVALQHELAQLQTQVASSTHDGAAPLDPIVVNRLYDPLQKAHKALEELSELCGAPASLKQLNTIDRHYRRIAKKTLPDLKDALHDAGIRLELELPPLLPASTSPAVLMESWEEAAQAAASSVEQLVLRLVQALGSSRVRERARLLERQLAALEKPVPAELQPDAALQRALFDAAALAREAWAALDADRLGKLVQRALAAAKGEFSLRPLWSDDPEDFAKLTQLFGVWGCTLLSLGNCIPARSGAIERVVIDEAGQCHPSYAVSALLRSRAALVIGDVHQLEPVIDLELSDDERVRESCKLTLDPAQLAPYRVHAAARCSVQSLADRAVAERPHLREHFRCQREIIAICDELCRYGLHVHTPLQAPSVPLPFVTQPVSLIDVRGEQERLGGSWHNAAELAVTLELLQALFDAGVTPEELAVITPYRGQLELLQKQLVRMGVPLDWNLELTELEQAGRSSERGLTLGTVHRFQGGERSIVLFSSVVSRRASLPFLDQRENLLNVAISRARHRFIAIGHRALLDSGQRTSLLTRAAAPLVPESFRRQLQLV